MAFTVLLSVLVAGCGIKWATNKVLSNPDAIAKVGAVYDVLTPRDTTERLVFIPGDSIVMETTDTIYIKGGLMSERNDKTDMNLSTRHDTIYVTKQRIVRKTDTIITRLPPDNRLISRLNDSVSHYKTITDRLSGEAIQYKQQVNTAEKRLIWMAAGILLLGTVIGLLIKFKVKL